MPDASPHVTALRLRSIALVGPYHTGKSTLFGELLAAAGAAKAERGDNVGAETRLAHCTYLGDHWSILDCSGSVESASAEAAALAVVDLAVVVCEPAPSGALAVAPVLRTLDQAGQPHIIFINEINMLEGGVRETLASLQAYSRRRLVLRQVPLREGGRVTGYADVVSERAYRYLEGEASELVHMPAQAEARQLMGCLGLGSGERLTGDSVRRISCAAGRPGAVLSMLLTTAERVRCRRGACRRADVRRACWPHPANTCPHPA